MCLRCLIERFVLPSMPEDPHHFLSAHASVNQMDKLAPQADSDGLHTSTLHRVPLARARPCMLFVFQVECVFISAEKAKIEEVQNERQVEGAVEGAGEVGGCGGGSGWGWRRDTATGYKTRDTKGGGTFAHISSQPDRWLHTVDSGSGDPSDSHDA